MPLELFWRHFPEIAKKETRDLTLVGGPQHGVPEGRYAFFELYCTERGCDCRRVMLQVVNERDGIVASVSYGFDRKAPMAGPYLDPLHKRASYAKGLVRLMEELVFSDPAYVARLERHYRMMKDKTDRPLGKEHWWKKKPKKPKRRRGP
jgi:hypothetical protein